VSERVYVDPTPIQRNTIDAAIELTQLYLRYGFNEPDEKLEDIYSRFFSLVHTLHRKPYDNLRDLVPDEILSKIK
jgi:hypothetical protein